MQFQYVRVKLRNKKKKKEKKVSSGFVESSLDREQNRLLLHIAPFKLFLFWTLQLLLPAGTVSGDNNQASTRKSRQLLTV